jgi:hypothetical protein
MSYIRKEDYSVERERPKLLTNYLEQMTTYLSLLHPDCSPDMIDGFVKEIIRERATSPQIEAIVHKTEGNSEIVKTRLDHYITNVVADNNLAPSGTCYHPISRKESFLRMSIDGKVKDRNAFKKKYLEFEAQGKKRESQYYNQNQANAKIFNNAIAGGMAMKQFILSDKAGFASITSAGRLCVKQGYSFIERAVNGNIYLPSVDDAISYTLNHIRHIPDEFAPLIINKILYTPSPNEVVAYLINSVRNYTLHLNDTHLLTLMTNMTEVERSYVFYAGCLNNLCRYNEDMMRQWIDSCFPHQELDPSLYQDISLDDVKTFRDDVIACVLSTNYKRLGLNPHKPGKYNGIKDAAKNNPEGLKEFIYCCRHFVTNFESLLYVIKPIFQVQTTFARMVFQQHMARYTVPLSDTDSNIFSTQELIRWKRGKIDFSQTSYEMNALVTFILSQSLEHVFARLSAGFGIEDKDVFRISMKNEFLYPILLATALAKHYMAIATMQEGALLPNPRKDIKGVGLRSSTYPKIIRDGFEEFIVNLFEEIEKGEPIRAASILQHVASVEQAIYHSISNADPDYLQTVSVRREEDYVDASKSQYFYYEMWQEVFAPDFGEMVIPNKCYKIPLKGGAKLFKSPEFLAKLDNQPELRQRLVAFMERNNGRGIKYLLVPPFKGKINPFFSDIFDIRSHICQIMAGYYHVLDAFSIGTVDIRVDGLVSDFYDPSQPLLE